MSPKNTGRGSRPTSGLGPGDPNDTWSYRLTSIGVFSEARRKGGSFKGVRREGARKCWWKGEK